MLDQHVAEYIFALSRDKRYDSGHIGIMSYLLSKSSSNGWSSFVRITYPELENQNMGGYRTVKKRLEDLYMFGEIEYESRRSYTIILLKFIREIINPSNINKAMKNICGIKLEDFHTRSFPVNGDISIEKNSIQPQNELKKIQDGKTTGDISIEKNSIWSENELKKIQDYENRMAKNMIVVLKKIQDSSPHLEKNSTRKQGYIEISSRWVIPDKQKGLMNLDRLDEERYRKFSHTLARINTNKDKTLISLLDLLDKIFLDGKFMDLFEEEVKKKGSSGSYIRYTSNGIEVKDKIFEHIPQGWHDYKESLFVVELDGKPINDTVDVTMTQATKEWFRYLHPICEKKGWDIELKIEGWSKKFNSGGVFRETKKPIKSIFYSMAAGSWWVKPFEEFSGKSDPNYDPETGIATDGRYGQEITF